LISSFVVGSFSSAFLAGGATTVLGASFFGSSTFLAGSTGFDSFATGFSSLAAFFGSDFASLIATVLASLLSFVVLDSSFAVSFAGSLLSFAASFAGFAVLESLVGSFTVSTSLASLVVFEFDFSSFGLSSLAAFFGSDFASLITTVFESLLSFVVLGSSFAVSFAGSLLSFAASFVGFAVLESLVGSFTVSTSLASLVVFEFDFSSFGLSSLAAFFGSDFASLITTVFESLLSFVVLGSSFAVSFAGSLLSLTASLADSLLLFESSCGLFEFSAFFGSIVFGSSSVLVFLESVVFSLAELEF